MGKTLLRTIKDLSDKGFTLDEINNIAESLIYSTEVEPLREHITTQYKDLKLQGLI